MEAPASTTLDDGAEWLDYRWRVPTSPGLWAENYSPNLYVNRARVRLGAWAPGGSRPRIRRGIARVSGRIVRSRSSRAARCVRGSTMRKLVAMIRDAGAAQVHLRIGSPAITHSCFYGIDTPTRSELIGSSHSVDEIARYLRVDSLGYLSLEGMLSCLDSPGDFCNACFSGDYSIPFDGEPDKLIFSKDS